MAEQKDLESVQRWTSKRRMALVLSIVKGETSAKEAARKHGLTAAEVEKWVELGLGGMENQLRSRPRDDEAFKEERIKQLERKVGQQALDMDILREASKLDRPTVGRMSDE